MALTTVPASLSATALTLTTAAQPNITSVGTLTGLTVDDITINGSTISDAADFILDVGGDITLDADGGDVLFKDGGTHFGSIYQNSNNMLIYSAISDADMLFQGNDGGSLITALTLDMSEAGAATFNSGLTVPGDLTVDTSTLKVDSSNNRVGIGEASPGFPLHVNSSGTDIAKFESSGSYTFTRFSSSSRNWALSMGSSFSVYDETASQTRLIIDSSGNVGIGDSTPQALLDVGGGYGGNTTVATFAHATDAYIEIENMTTQNGAGIILTNAGTKKWTIQKDTSAHGLYIQDGSTNPNMTFLQGGNVGIGTTNPTSNLGWNKFLLVDGGTSNAVIVGGTDNQQANIGAVDGLYIDVYGHTTATNNNIIFRTQNANSVSAGIERMRITSGGNVNIAYGVSNTQTTWPLHVTYSNNSGAHGGIQVKNTNAGSTSNFAGMSAHAVNGGVQAFYYAADYDTWGVGAFAGSASNHHFHLMSNNTERVRIENDGDVKIVSGRLGIGMDAAQALDIDKTSGLSLRFYNSGTFKAGLQSVTGSGQMVGTSAVDDLAIRSQSDIVFGAGGNTERMRMKSNGTVTLSGDDYKFVDIVYRKSYSLNRAYTHVANINGSGLGSSYEVHVRGTTSSVVVNAHFHIMVGHYKDIAIKSFGGAYTACKVKVVSNNNEDSSLYIGIASTNNNTATCVVSIRAHDGVPVDMSPSSAQASGYLEHAQSATSTQETTTGTSTSGSGPTNAYTI